MKTCHYTTLILCCLLFLHRYSFCQSITHSPNKLLDFTGGSSTYLFNYRSAIDTPYTEGNILQNNISGNLDVTVANKIPLRILYWGRYSNSNIFRNITDVQVSLNQQLLKNNWQQVIRKRLLQTAEALEDSTLKKKYQLKRQQWKELSGWLKDPLNNQKLIEANEIVRVPHITYNASLPDSINKRKADSLKRWANNFIKLYDTTKLKYDKAEREVDSLEGLYNKNIEKVTKLKSLSDKNWSNPASLDELQAELHKLDISKPVIPSNYKWLTGIRNFSAGRVPLNQTALTTKDISIKGINFEYNSWYYLAVAAGVVDYRFRDFALPKTIRTPQYLYMLRVGIGRLEHNYFILSAYRGQKQLFVNNLNTAGVSSINVLGYSAQAKLCLTRYIYAIGEIAESVSPNYYITPSAKTTSFNFSDNSNKGISLQLYSFFPKTNTRLQGMYKYTGANFQSFSSFQTNASLRSWNIQGEQYFIDKQIRVTASLKNNDFANPFFIQSYNSSTIFKSLSATLRVKRWPVVSVGYQPISQLTVLNEQTVEARFQTININICHSYKLANVPLASSIVFNRFYNTNADTGFVYYNAVNIFISQNLFFDFFNTCLSVSHTKNRSYELNVMDQNIQFTVTTAITAGGGVKLNRINQNDTKIGAYLNASFRINRKDVIYMNYERGFLPGFNGGLIKNEMGTVRFTKSFQFK